MKLTITESFEDFTTTYSIEFNADEADLAVDIMSLYHQSLLDEPIDDGLCDCCDTIDEDGYALKFNS